MLFRPRITTVFASRKKALLWCASILLSVYWFIPSPQQPGDGPSDEEAAASAVMQIVGGGAQPSPSPSSNPWAPDTPAPKH
jgi:hypothetical protein